MGTARAGFAFGCSGTSSIKWAYAVGRVEISGAGFTAGPCGGVVVRSYYDVETTGQLSSSTGTPITTKTLQRRLPGGFSSTVWAITPNVSYPYLKIPELVFNAPLAAVARNQTLYLFLPIGQRDSAEYSNVLAMKGSTFASLGAVYAMIGRSVGVADQISQLQTVKIDSYWDGNKAIWQGTVTQHATLSAFSAVSGAINETNIIGLIRRHKPAILQGTYMRSGVPTHHWMLATSFVTDDGGAIVGVIANDPWTGRQVTIDPTTKAVIVPANFPLENFAVDAYAAISLN
jgi:hypothetical protein